MPTIEFRTFETEAYELFKPVLAKSFMPDWWKKMKVQSIHRNLKTQTIRSCPAMHDWLTMGWYMISCVDIMIDVDESTYPNKRFYAKEIEPQKGQKYASASHGSNQVHDYFTYLGADGPVKDAFKLRAPWNIKVPQGYSIMHIDPFMFQNKHFATWQGIIDADGFNVNMDNAQIIFYPKTDEPFIIPKNTPLVQIIPFKRDEWHATYLLAEEPYIYEEVASEKSAQRGQDMWKYRATSKGKDVDEALNIGGYRSAGIWQEKGQFFSEDECPFHKKKEDDSPETQLELDV